MQIEAVLAEPQPIRDIGLAILEATFEYEGFIRPLDDLQILELAKRSLYLCGLLSVSPKLAVNWITIELRRDPDSHRTVMDLGRKLRALNEYLEAKARRQGWPICTTNRCA